MLLFPAFSLTLVKALWVYTVRALWVYTERASFWFNARVTKIEDRKGLDIDTMRNDPPLNFDDDPPTLQLVIGAHGKRLRTLGKPLLPDGDTASPFPIQIEGSEALKPKALNRVLHQYITCDGCKMSPVEGTRFKSKKKSNYGLCSNCFERADDQAEYVHVNQPPDPNGLRVFTRNVPFWMSWC